MSYELGAMNLGWLGLVLQQCKGRCRNDPHALGAIDECVAIVAAREQRCKTAMQRRLDASLLEFRRDESDEA